MSEDIVDRANESLSLWDQTSGVEIEVLTGMAAAREAYYDAPELVRALVAEIKKWRDVAEEVDAFTPDELETQMRVSGYSIEIGKWGYWGIYALEGLFEDLGIQPGDCYPEAVARVRKGLS